MEGKVQISHLHFNDHYHCHCHCRLAIHWGHNETHPFCLGDGWSVPVPLSAIKPICSRFMLNILRP
jgi:hypothetical protein